MYEKNNQILELKSYFQHLIDEIILDYPLCWARRYSKCKFIYQLTFNVPVIYLFSEYYAILPQHLMQQFLCKYFIDDETQIWTERIEKWTMRGPYFLTVHFQPSSTLTVQFNSNFNPWIWHYGEKICTYSWKHHVINLQKYHLKHFEIASVRNWWKCIN